MRTLLFLSCFLITVQSGISQVNLQNGSGEQSFPLISYSDTKAGLSMGVGISYASGNGLMVNEIASNVGTGWTLEAGGFITRIQNGQPDDQPERNTGFFWADEGDDDTYRNVYKNYPPGYMYNSNAGNGCNVKMLYYPVLKTPGIYKEMNIVTADTEQDKFIFRMNGRTGVFVIGRDWKVTTIGDSRIKVSFTTLDMTNQGIRTRINQFTIITEDGIKYIFRDLGLSQLMRYKNSRMTSNGWVPISGRGNGGAYQLNKYWGYAVEQEYQPYIVNSWYLSEMENTNNGQKILFNYQGIVNDVVTSKQVSHARDLNNSPPPKRVFDREGARRDRGREWMTYLSNPTNANAFQWDVNKLNALTPTNISLVYGRSVMMAKRIASINLPNGGIISFQYNARQRADLKGDNALEYIQYSVNGTIVRKFKFEMGYMYRNSIHPYTYPYGEKDRKFARLCLLSIQKLGDATDNASEPPYRFSYYTGSVKGSKDDIVPAWNFLAQDHWGYYNGDKSGLSLTEDHDFLSDEGMQYFKTVLAKNHNPKRSYAKNGLLRAITYPTGGTLTYEYSQNESTQQLVPANYEQMAGGVSVSKIILSDGENAAKDITKEYKYVGASNEPSRWSDEKPVYYSLNLNRYDEEWKNFKYPAVEFPEMAVSIDPWKIIAKALFSSALNIGISIAIQALVTSTAVVPVINIITLAIAIIVGIVEANKDIEFHRYVLGNQNFIQSNPLGIYHSRVEVTGNSPTGNNGKTVFEFTDLTNYAPQSSLWRKYEWPYISAQRLVSWAYGLPKKTTVYDKDGVMVNQSENFYKTISEKLVSQNNLNYECNTRVKTSSKSPEWEKQNVLAWYTTKTEQDLIVQSYFQYTGRTDLISSTETAYVNGQQYFKNAVNYVIDPLTLLQKGKIISKDNNKLIFQLSFYPKDYTIGGALELLRNRNAIHTPVATETWQLTVNGAFQTPRSKLELLDASVTEYKTYTLSNGHEEVKPWKIYQLKSKAPVPTAVIGPHNPAVLIRNAQLFKVQTEFFYDNEGNLIQQVTDGNIVSFVNDYNSRYVVASVANAGFSDIAYTSFESNGQGNWLFTPAHIRTNTGLTGTKAFKLGPDPIIGGTSIVSRTGLNPAKKYIVSFWTKNVEPDYVLVNGQNADPLYNLPDGWTLYQKEVTGVNEVTLSGDATIDEVRLYPKGTLMSSVAYKEGIGKMADCDANSRLMFYEYDALGRLKVIRDQNKNIVKTYEYNYKK